MASKFLLDIVDLIKKGYNPSKICLKLNITKQSLNYYLKTLKEENLITKVGYGTWEVNEVKLKMAYSNPNPTSKNIRGHAFIWKVRFNKSYNWKELLESKQINYDEVGIYNTPRIILNNIKIWFGKDNLVFYMKDSFFAKNSIESKKLAVYSLLETVCLLSNTLSTPLTNYKFTSAKEHYSLIQNCLAIQCDKEGKSINIKNEEGYWMSIDNSLNLHEAEAIGKDSMLDIEGIKKYFNAHKETQFKVTPTFLLENLNKVASNQLYESSKWAEYGRDIVEHKEAIKKLGDSIVELTKIIKELKNGV